MNEEQQLAYELGLMHWGWELEVPNSNKREYFNDIRKHEAIARARELGVMSLRPLYGGRKTWTEQLARTED